MLRTASNKRDAVSLGKDDKEEEALGCREEGLRLRLRCGEASTNFARILGVGVSTDGLRAVVRFFGRLLCSFVVLVVLVVLVLELSLALGRCGCSGVSGSSFGPTVSVPKTLSIRQPILLPIHFSFIACFPLFNRSGYSITLSIALR